VTNLRRWLLKQPARWESDSRRVSSFCASALYFPRVNVVATNALHTDRPEDRLSIRTLHLADTIFARIYHHLTVLSPCRIPRSGPAILVCNHTSSIDPAFLQAVCHQRLITWMMAKEYLEIKAMRWVFKEVGIIPVDRGSRDIGSLRAGMRALEAGRVLGIFPEGRIASTRELLPFQTGLALMAIKTKVPVYPAYLDGTQRNKGMLQACLQPNETILAFGPPVEFDRDETSRESIEAGTLAIRTAIERLREQTLQSMDWHHK
jgi:1-acyl-sn-glycerol-3-phosphate acyltransferase